MKNDTLILLAIAGIGLYLWIQKGNAANNTNNSLASQYTQVTQALTNFEQTLSDKVSGIQAITNENNYASDSMMQALATSNAANAFGNNSGSLNNNPDDGPSGQTTADPDTSPGGLSEEDFVSQALNPNNQGPI